jgi:hypothetical protein
LDSRLESSKIWQFFNRGLTNRLNEFTLNTAQTPLDAMQADLNAINKALERSAKFGMDVNKEFGEFEASGMSVATTSRILGKSTRDLINWRNQIIALQDEFARAAQVGEVDRAANAQIEAEQEASRIRTEALTKARGEILALGDPIQKLTAQFESQKAKLEAFAKQFPELAGEAQRALGSVSREYTRGLNEAREAMELLNNQAASMDDLHRFQMQIDHLTVSMAGYSAAAIRAGQATAQSISVPRDQAKLLEQSVGHLEDNDRVLKQFFTKVNEQNIESTSRIVELGEAYKATTDEMSVFAEQAARNMQDSFAQFLFDPFESGLKGMLKGFVDILRRMLAEAMSARIFEAIGGGSGGGFTDFLGGLFSFGGAAAGGSTGGGGPVMPRAAGGPVSGGRSYIVGEKGPELFVPGASGSIIPNGHGMTGTTLAPTYNIDARGATMELVKALPAILQENNRRMMEALRDARTRGQF